MGNSQLIDEMSEDELADEIKSIGNLPSRGRGARFKFNPNPFRKVETTIGKSRQVIDAAKIVCRRNADQSCSHTEISAVLGALGIDMKAADVLKFMHALTDTSGAHRTASAIFIKVHQQVKSGLESDPVPADPSDPDTDPDPDPDPEFGPQQDPLPEPDSAQESGQEPAQQPEPDHSADSDQPESEHGSVNSLDLDGDDESADLLGE